ncbi:Peptidoglycan/LPS O-acetylase OafA/YrhL, contains acyltransferase and SGNH-hydrolase domains [Pseudomonas sp. NFIX10]|uniref:acyltransferase family protein n=1 Tax=unclassified Pseudomonas TaxID=196821 RepID=UPI0008E11111|nr:MULTISPECIES: acyltransferase [unclassified Pseudomonas]SFB41100.1 Peptidoglycan/LPS O-acetylase OafA/YrhL, contains acyltransferase and SGNH-hydrolase domains [Pseudomonas sp. NFIX10]SFF28145.1 Peptidoglycan/LPS O-acetylase OafA/YrhL, contains acyltransferase and SGNH-hydrolase domains [Pseudomonas sp. NFACC06-1]
MRAEKRFQSLDSFRGLMAISVMLYHLRVSGSFTEWLLFRHAEVFVSFFFVLSGFVLTHAYGSSALFNFRKFFITRTFRLLPLHLFMLSIFILLECGRYLVAQKGMDFNNSPFTEKFAPSEILPNVLLLQSWTYLTNPLSFNYPSWSISIEYYTYMIFALILGIAFGIRTWVWVTVVFVALALMHAGNTFFTIESLRGLAYFFTGCLAYAVYLRLPQPAQAQTWLLTTFEVAAVVVALVFVINDFAAKPLWASPLFGVIVVIFAFDRGAVSRLLAGRGFGFLGKLSYSIYLTHAAVLFCVVSAFMVAKKISGVDIAPVIDGTRYLDLGNGPLNNLIALLTAGAAVLVSMFTYRYVEMPGQSLGRALSNTPTRNSPALRPDTEV